MFLWVVKALVVLYFLVMFVRRPSLGWGVGLLTVTAALFVDAFGEVLGRDVVLDRLGFFQWIIGGGLAAGAFFWLGSLVRPQMAVAPSAVGAGAPATPGGPAAPPARGNGSTLVDRKLLYDQIRHNLGPDDVLDLIFDLDLNENDVVNPALDMPRIIVNVMDAAEAQGLTGMLAMAVERILTPVPKENLPRLEKISAESPSTVLRQFLIANYDNAQLADLARALSLDWEQFGSGPKKTRVRHLLLHLRRRNRLPELIDRMQLKEEVAV